MKKLMIAAAAAAMVGGAFAGACEPEEKGDCALVYKVSMSVKTTKGIVGSETSGTLCAPGVECVVIRVKDSTKIEGWIYDCSCGCDLIKGGSAVAWDSKRKAQITGAAFNWAFANVMGKKQSDAEAVWEFTGTATYDDARAQEYNIKGAGYGKYSTSKEYFTSFSGNFAGSASGSFDLKTTKNITDYACVCQPSQIWDCNDLTTLADSDTLAYGTWSMKYNSSASKKYLSNGTLSVPSYVTVGE